MAMTLAEAAKYAPTDHARGIMEAFVLESSILDRLPLMPIAGNAYSYSTEYELPGVAFRAVNEAYVESTGTIVEATERLKILGGDADVDRFLVQTTPTPLSDLRAEQEVMKVKALNYQFHDTFFNGDSTVDPKSFDGLKKRLTGSQVLDADTNGMGPVAGGHNFLDALDALFASVTGGADVAYANRRVLARIKSAGRRVGGVDVVTSDLTGKREVTWNGVPILDAGSKANGQPVIPQTETQGTSSTASSVYAVKFGQNESDQATTGLINGTVDVRDLGEIDSKPVYRTRIEAYIGLATFSGQAAARLRGVLDA